MCALPAKHNGLDYTLPIGAEFGKLGVYYDHEETAKGSPTGGKSKAPSLKLLWLLLSSMVAVEEGNCQWCPTHNGLYPNVANCKCYYKCIGGVPKQKWCPPGQKFDVMSMSCTFPSNTVCAGSLVQMLPAMMSSQQGGSNGNGMKGYPAPTQGDMMQMMQMMMMMMKHQQAGNMVTPTMNYPQMMNQQNMMMNGGNNQNMMNGGNNQNMMNGGNNQNMMMNGGDSQNMMMNNNQNMMQNKYQNMMNNNNQNMMNNNNQNMMTKNDQSMMMGNNQNMMMNQQNMMQGRGNEHGCIGCSPDKKQFSIHLTFKRLPIRVRLFG